MTVVRPLCRPVARAASRPLYGFGDDEAVYDIRFDQGRLAARGIPIANFAFARSGASGMVFDHEGMLHQATGNELRLHGLRRVRNRVGLYIENWTGIGPGITVQAGFPAPDGSLTAYRVTIPQNTSDSLIETFSPTTGSQFGKYILFSCWMRRVSGTLGAGELVLSNGSDSATLVHADLDGMTEWTRVQTGIAAGLSLGYPSSGHEVGFVFQGNETALVIDLWHPQAEERLHPNTLAASEYVAFDTLAPAYKNGVFSGGVAYFPTTNGNTATALPNSANAYVVTEGNGAPLDGQGALIEGSTTTTGNARGLSGIHSGLTSDNQTSPTTAFNQTTPMGFVGCGRTESTTGVPTPHTLMLTNGTGVLPTLTAGRMAVQFLIGPNINKTMRRYVCIDLLTQTGAPRAVLDTQTGQIVAGSTTVEAAKVWPIAAMPGWFRVWIGHSVTSTAQNSITVSVQDTAAANATWTGDIGYGFALCGLSIESGNIGTRVKNPVYAVTDSVTKPADDLTFNPIGTAMPSTLTYALIVDTQIDRQAPDYVSDTLATLLSLGGTVDNSTLNLQFGKDSISVGGYTFFAAGTNIINAASHDSDYFTLANGRVVFGAATTGAAVSVHTNGQTLPIYAGGTQGINGQFPLARPVRLGNASAATAGLNGLLRRFQLFAKTKTAARMNQRTAA